MMATNDELNKLLSETIEIALDKLKANLNANESEVALNNAKVVEMLWTLQNK